ncbi:hypothetical protein EsH8_X_000344 [Colletotrichum jinshuiense]
MVSLSFLAPAKVVSTLVVLLALTDSCAAAGQCGIVTSSDCGKNKRRAGHKLPTSVGSTYYVNGFNGGVMNAKFQSMRQSVAGNSDYVDLTYNFNLGSYDGAYWILLPTSFGGANTCYGVWKNCDVTIRFWNKKDPLPTWYTLT